MATINSDLKSFKVQHFLIRLMERFAIKITPQEHKEIISKVKNYTEVPEYKPLIIQDDGTSFHKIEIQGQTVIGVFDWTYNCFVTCYMPSWLSYQDGQWVLKRKSKSKTIRYHNRANTKALKFL